MCGPIQTPMELVCFFLDNMFLQSAFFPILMSYIHGPKKEEVRKVMLERFDPAIYIFSRRTDPFPRAMRDQQGRPGERMLSKHITPSLNSHNML